MLYIHLVLYQLDDAEDEVGVAQPAEHIVEYRHILILYALRDAVRERCQHHAGDIGIHRLDVAGHGKGIVVGITRHTDDQVDVRRLQSLSSLLRRRHLRERRRIAHTQLHVLVEQLLVNASVVLQHEGVVRVSHYQDIKDALCHQVDKRHILQKEVIELLWYICIHNQSS